MCEVLQQIDREKQKVKENMALNIEELILPIIAKLKRKHHSTDVHYFISLEKSLQDLSSNLGRHFSRKYLILSPREIEIATMIRHGLPTKVIAQTLNITVRTVENHRNSIRRKVGIQNSNINLRSYLQSLETTS